MSLETGIDDSDLQKQLEKLKRYPKIYDKHVKKALDDSGQNVRKRWWFIAPIDTGLYRRRLKNVTEKKSGNLRAVISTDATSRRGFPYPGHLETSSGYHYRSTSRKGQALIGRVAEMLGKAQNMINKNFRKALDKIVRDLVVK